MTKANEVVEQRKTRLCPLTRSEFQASANPLVADIAGQKLVLNVKEFKSDANGKSSFGWNGNGKATIMFGDVPVAVQMGFNLTVIGSKDANP